jgi:nuclear pore complex protein Nup54
VPAEAAPYYHPNPGEDEKKWEEALQKKPNETAIPVLIRGFWDLGERIKMQDQAVKILRQRMHDINKSLDQRMQDHDLKFTAKVQNARRKHVELSRRTLALATKVQVLRNRGYALDSTEEELRKKLQQLEKGAFDPVLGGRQEEIWARLTVVRERAEMLQNEVKKMGKEAGGVEEVIDEENMKAIKKVRSTFHLFKCTRLNVLQLLSDYDSQLEHLKKELDLIRDDFTAWESTTKPSSNLSGSSR